MNRADAIYLINNASFQTLVPQTAILTEADIKSYENKNYIIAYTLDKFQNAYPDINPEHFYYANDFTGAYYWDDLVIFPVHLYRDQFLSPKGWSLENYIKKGIADTNYLIEQNDFSFVCNRLNDRLQMEYLEKLINKNVPHIYSIFLRLYPRCTYGCNSLGHDSMNILLSVKNDIERRRTEEKLLNFPDTLTVYRGVGEKSVSLNSAFSWTLDINVAFKFAARFDKNDACIYTAQIAKDDVIEYFDERGELECLVFPESLLNISSIPIYDLKWLDEVIPIIATSYITARDDAMYYEICFEADSDYHNTTHCCRVLLLCLLLSYLYDLGSEDVNILTEAALYHDTGRLDDEKDECHGKRSAQKYAEAVENPDPIILFLMEYHCQSDEEGLSQIETDPVLSKQKQRVIQLFYLFKDADALDRIRFGLGADGLDLNQLRTKEAKSLSLVAMIALEQIEA